MSTPNPDHSEGDYSFSVAFSAAYKLVAKQSQSAESDWDEETWRRKALETGWMGLYRYARHAGLTDAEAEKTAQEILVAAMRRLVDGRDGMTVETFKEQLLLFARSLIAERRKRNHGPYYVSTAWREKHDAA